MPRKTYPYKPEYAEQGRKLCLLGATNKDLADFFNITESVLKNWESRHPEFHKELELGRAIADGNVAESLYRKAVGFTHKTEKAFQYQGEGFTVDVEESVPPSDVACIFWLKNRRKDVWKDRHEHQLGAEEGLIGLLSALNAPPMLRPAPVKKRNKAKPDE